MGSYLRKYFSGLHASAEDATAKRVRDLRIKLILLILVIALCAFMILIDIHTDKLRLGVEQTQIDNAFIVMQEFRELENKVVSMDTDSLIIYSDYILFNTEHSTPSEIVSFYGVPFFRMYYSSPFYNNYQKRLLEDLKTAISIEKADEVIAMLEEKDKAKLIRGSQADLSKYGVEFDNQRSSVAEALEAHLRNNIIRRLTLDKSSLDEIKNEK